MLSHEPNLDNPPEQNQIQRVTSLLPRVHRPFQRESLSMQWIQTKKYHCSNRTRTSTHSPLTMSTHPVSHNSPLQYSMSPSSQPLQPTYNLLRSSPLCLQQDMKPLHPSYPSCHRWQWWQSQNIICPNPLQLHSTRKFWGPVIHPTTWAVITKYQKLMKDPILKKVWTISFGKEFGRLAQGDKKTGTQGSNTLFVMTHHEVDNTPRDQTITYGCIVIGYHPQKPDPNQFISPWEVTWLTTLENLQLTPPTSQQQR